MNILSFISDIFKPAADVIDAMHTSTEEKLQMQNALTKLENDLTMKILAYETKLVESQAKIVTAEADGQSWLQRNWRPISMMTFLVLVVLDSFGLLAFRLSEDAWALLKIGLGGYAVGRTVEKVTSKITNVIKKQP